MQALVVTPVVFGSVKGGGERYVSEALKGLIRLGVNTSMLIVTGPYRFQIAEVDGSTRTVQVREANQLVRNSDVVHVHQLNSPGFDYAALACRIYRKPLILTDHGGGWRNPGRILGRQRVRFVDGGAFVSRWSAQDVDPRNIIPERWVVSGGGDHLPPAEPWAERFDFGFVGRILPHKGLHVIVEALSADNTLVVAGQARDSEYMSEIRGLATGKNVTFIDNADDRVIAGLYKSVRYQLVPSVFRYKDRRFKRPELMGFAALEALSMGTPVIGSDVAGLGEVLRDAKQQVLPPGDVEAWRASLTQAMKQKPQEVQTERFRWDAVAERCINLYKTVIQRRDPSA